MKTFLSLMNRIPPPMAVLIAREGRHPMTLSKVAQKANLSLQRVVWVSSQKTWEAIPTGEASSILSACGITPSTIGRQIQYIRRTRKTKAPLAKRLQQPGSLRLVAALAP